VKKVSRDKLSALERRVLGFIRRHDLLKGGTLLVAVSGGPDSVCMLLILYKLRDELGISLHVVHLDHQLRGAESEADARYVAELVRRLGLPATIETRDVLSYQKKYRLSPEEAAREVRYSFIAEIAAKIKTGRVAVGHTLDDNTETILMHLIRGSGTRGMAGLQPSSHWHMGNLSLEVVRPLLPVSREETQAYCREHELAPRTDSTNLSLSPLRNKIRLQLLPLLKSYNPNIAEALLRTASIAGEEQDLIGSLGNIAWESTVRGENNTVVFKKDNFTALHSALQRHLIRKAIETIRSGAANPLKDIESVHVEEIKDALHKPAGKVIHLPYGLVFSVEYDRYLLGTDPAALSPFPSLDGETRLAVPGSTFAGKWQIRTYIIRPEQMKKSSDFTARFDFDKTGGELAVRTYRTGDCFQPLGMERSKKLGNFMIDARIPHAWRERIPVVTSPQHIIWLVGYRIDETVKVTDETKRVLLIKFKVKD
jgi:tRNA(Ile)-lysidine synthase